jgi:hypothetical protein
MLSVSSWVQAPTYYLPPIVLPCLGMPLHEDCPTRMTMALGIQAKESKSSQMALPFSGAKTVAFL